MSAPRGFITDEAMLERVAKAMVADLHIGYGYDKWDDMADWLRDKWLHSAKSALAAAQGDAPTTPEPLPPLVEDIRTQISHLLRVLEWPDQVQITMSTEEARALLAWLDRGRP